MIGNKIVFSVRERRNTFARGGKEWALYASFVGEVSEWTLKTWRSKPSDETVWQCLDLIMRSFEFYHKHLKIPAFNLEVVESWRSAPEMTKGGDAL